MVLLTMTTEAVSALEALQKIVPDELQKLRLPSEPSLNTPAPGNPISHSQLVDLSKLLKTHNPSNTPTSHLNSLLRGSKVYIPPPPPKKEPTSEYKALMARLRAAEEYRLYAQMTNPVLPATAAPLSHFSTPADLAAAAADDVDEVTYADVHRQMILIINVLVSIIATSVFIWVAARHWSAPKRLGLSMGGSGLVAVAEVVIYAGYVGRITEAKKVERGRREVKEVVETWVIEKGRGGKREGLVDVTSGKSGARVEDGVRQRRI
ncbi:uncharacterized protein BDZ99DRAFT_175209 [Mytilinidion resinicola]|uniref:Uncharacterized protein n=1 Tax=Mytilinidion resinicola TaxID=574789 RepID=A0A6A6Y3B0_9PEZI|nr:uncharacterized protein BDZ99DRAFT_175209 [Mytilinidion resinicola]KAF2803150.1 hypothetical protein BDZ99DRAFT_175209 [Mytilinidion resinicola]